MVTLPSVSRGHHQSMEVTPPWLIHYPTINSENGFLTMTLIHKWTHIHVSTKITFNPLLSAGKHGFLDNDLYLIHVSSRSTLIRYVTSAGCYFLCISRKSDLYCTLVSSGRPTMLILCYIMSDSFLHG